MPYTTTTSSTLTTYTTTIPGPLLKPSTPSNIKRERTMMVEGAAIGGAALCTAGRGGPIIEFASSQLSPVGGVCI
jgi:hypothetical protein